MNKRLKKKKRTLSDVDKIMFAVVDVELMPNATLEERLKFKYKLFKSRLTWQHSRGY